MYTQATQFFHSKYKSDDDEHKDKEESSGIHHVCERLQEESLSCSSNLSFYYDRKEVRLSLESNRKIIDVCCNCFKE
jgi:hypothetical protein